MTQTAQTTIVSNPTPVHRIARAIGKTLLYGVPIALAAYYVFFVDVVRDGDRPMSRAMHGGK